MKAVIHTWVQVHFLTMLAVFAGCWVISAGENALPAGTVIGDDLSGIVNPFDSTCYDWRGHEVPCEFKRPYAEILIHKSMPVSRFVDNQDGTLTDRLTGLTWLKHMNCFGMLDWQNAALAAKGLEHGDCGPNPIRMLADGSSAGDWRLPTMKELCTLIDFGRRDPALSSDHLFLEIPSGYHWSATIFDYDSEKVWIVYFESGTTCYEDVKNRAGHVLPVRGPMK